MYGCMDTWRVSIQSGTNILLTSFPGHRKWPGNEVSKLLVPGNAATKVTWLIGND